MLICVLDVRWRSFVFIFRLRTKSPDLAKDRAITRYILTVICGTPLKNCVPAHQ
jgi:hypothetical protein